MTQKKKASKHDLHKNKIAVKQDDGSFKVYKMQSLKFNPHTDNLFVTIAPNIKNHIDNNYFKVDNENVFIMKSTSERDKKGVLMYQNDIVKTDNGYELITWDEDMLSFYISNDNEQFCKDDGQFYEVVGNIYQDKHLLERCTNG